MFGFGGNKKVTDDDVYMVVKLAVCGEGTPELHMHSDTERALSRHLAMMTENETMPVLGSFQGHSIVIDQTVPFGKVALATT